jgi:hypothetical protein
MDEGIFSSDSICEFFFIDIRIGLDIQYTHYKA